ncbi:MAG: PAS domain S-box protein [candidate division Zixibacteria bacterium]|nr:PAS domain S-box protein [candidate division Zixibacteria bacterium]
MMAILIISVVLQSCAAYMALRIIPITRRRKAWILVASALSLLAVRRAVTAYYTLLGTGEVTTIPLAEIIAMTGSAVLVVGMAAIRPMFLAMRASEEAVRQSERRFRNLYESAPCGFLSVDREGIIRQCNRRAEQILGYARGTLLGVPMAGLLLEADGDNHGRSVMSSERLWQGASLTDLEVQMCTADARAIWVSLTIDPIMDTHDTLTEFRAIIVDITDRLVANDQLRSTQFAVDHVGEAVTQIGADGRFLYANDITVTSLGYPRAVLLTKHIWDIDPRLSEAGWPTFWDDLRHRGTVVMESEARHADGSLHPVEATVSYVDLSGHEFLFSFVRDISERKRVQRDLQLTKFSVDHAGEAIHWVDENARLIYVNDAACAGLGYTREELLSKTLHDIDPVLRKDRWAEEWAGSTPGKTRVFESLHRRKDGTLYQIEVNITTLQLDGLKINCAFIRDISDRRKAEETLRLSEERFRVCLKNSPIVMFNQDSELRYTWVYHPVEGTREGGIIGLTDNDLLALAEANPLMHFKKSVIETGLGRRGEFKLTMIKGNPRIYDLTAEPLRDPTGAIVGITCAAVDVTDVRDMQQSLRESEELHRTVVNALDEGVLLWGRGGRVLAVNPSAERILKISVEQVLANPAPAQDWEFLRADGTPFALEDLPSERAIRTGEACTDMIVGIRRPGSDLQWFSVNSRPVYHSGQSEPYAAVLSFRDITSIKATQDALRESERRFREMLTGVQLIALTLDINGRVTFCNDHLLKLTGWQRDEVIGQGWFDRFVPVDVRAEINPSFRHDTPLGMIPTYQENDILTKDGRRRLIRWSNTILRDPQGQVIGTASLGEDITERKQAEETLQRDLVFKTAVVDISEHALLPTADIASIARLVLERAMALTGSKHGFVAEVDPASGDVISHTLTQMMDAGCEVTLNRQSIVFPKGLNGYTGLWGYALNTEKPFYTNSPPDHPGFQNCCPKGHVPIERFLSVPATSGKKIVGQIALANPSADYTDDQLDSIRELAAVYAMAVEHLHSEGALRHREHQLEEAQRLALVGSWELDLSTDTLVWSDEIFRIFEIDSDQFGASYEMFLSTVHPEDREMVDRTFSDSLANKTPYHVVHRLLFPDGRVKYVHERGETHYDDSGHPRRTVGTVQDITEQKHSEEQIVILKRALDAHHDGVYWIDSDNKFVYVNDAACRVLGYEQQELIGATIDKINPLATPERMAHVWDILRRDGFYTSESRHRRRDGSELPVEMMTTYVLHEGREYAAGFARDISERKHAEEELQRALSRYESVIQQTPLVAVQSLERDGTIRSWNPACERLYGYQAADVIGRQIQEQVFSEQEALNFEDTLHTVWDEHKPSTPRERAAHTRDGAARITYSAMFPILEDKTVVEVIRMDVDITDRKQAEEQLLRAKRLEAAGQLAGQIAHDFNNLLGPLVAYPELIAPHLPPDARLQEMLHDMAAAARQIADINQELLTMSRRGHYNLEPLDLNRLVEHCLRTVSTPAPITIARELSERLPLVRGGASQIMRLLNNLINNAFDAMPDGGALTVRTAKINLDAPLKRYPDVRPGEFVRLDITDTGRGIPTGAVERIFEPFFTTKKADRRRGSGLGLAVVHSVMEDHEGYVDFDSEPGKGTTFSLYFPVNPVPSPEPAPDSSVPMGTGQRVLVVDDDSMQRRIAERTLKRLGYVVQTVASGEEAVEFVAQHPQEILLLDMVMDGIDGTETLRRIKRQYPDQIAIILSGYACSDRVDEAMRLGAKGFIQKPVHLATLAAALHDALHKQAITATPVVS